MIRAEQVPEVSQTTQPRTWSGWIAGITVLLFSLPLFLGLDRWDMRNDESIYSYAVQRILETGEWLTPRSIPTDTPFLEKPPLKFWLVAAPMWLGLTPTDEFGMRVIDALFGAAAFGYVMAFGWRLGGPFCGAVALLVLLAFDPLLFEHGLRSNNMEGALVLAYCGGLFHVLRWMERRGARAGRWHALAAALFFVLGFMTKFVAALFLPVVAAAAFLARGHSPLALLRTWRDWVVPGEVAAALILPWFVYQWLRDPAGFWSGIFGHHVYRRFTDSLDPAHLQAWHYYFTATGRELELGDALLPVLAGLVALSVSAWRHRHGDARLLLIWWLLPFTLISFGTSKLLHYAYPFLPPLALGAGLAASRLVRLAGRSVSLLPAWARWADFVGRRRALQVSFALLASACLLMALWTFLTGDPVLVTFGDVRIFRNSSIVRPILAAALLMALAGRGPGSAGLVVAAALMLALPVQAYEEKVTKALSIDHPLRTASTCIAERQRTGRTAASGLYLSNPARVSHPPFYYFRTLGPWSTGPEGWRDDVVGRLADGRPSLIVREQWAELRAVVDVSRLTTVALQWDLVLLLPGAYGACEGPILQAGGRPFSALAANTP